MIILLEEGKYILLETKGGTKILSLAHKTYAWIHAEDIGELLITTHKTHVVDHVLSRGCYRVYNVEDEQSFSDQMHLELFVGDSLWQGYLLPTGLPTDQKMRNRIIPTHEIITKYSH